jgi:hypothetical protein
LRKCWFDHVSEWSFIQTVSQSATPHSKINGQTWSESNPTDWIKDGEDKRKPKFFKGSVVYVSSTDGSDIDVLCGIDEEKECLTMDIAKTHFDELALKTIKLVDSYSVSSSLDLSGIGVESSSLGSKQTLSFDLTVSGSDSAALSNTLTLTLTDISLLFGSTNGKTHLFSSSGSSLTLTDCQNIDTFSILVSPFLFFSLDFSSRFSLFLFFSLLFLIAFSSLSHLFPSPL